jgi:pimeloyl-ACP methyl ester carboxylesterase
MNEPRSVSFYSAGSKLDGDLYVPEGAANAPAVVVLSGYAGLKGGVPALWCPRLAARGFVALGFDYRGLGASEGKPGNVSCQDEVADTRAAVSFLETLPEVDAERIGVFGWAQAGAIAIVAAADDERIKGVVTVHAQGDTGRVTRRLHTDESWAALQQKLAADRRERVLTGTSELIDPFELLPLEPETEAIVRDRLYRLPNYGSPVSLEAAEDILGFRAEDVVDRIAPRPLLLVHGGANKLHVPDESKRLYERAREPKELLILEGKSHLDWTMQDGDTTTFGEVVAKVADFYSGL